MSKRDIVVVALVSAAIGAGLMFLVIKTGENSVLPKHVQAPADIVQMDQKDAKVEMSDRPKDISRALSVISEEGLLLSVRDGDVWQSDLTGQNKVKLIDRDNIESAKFSPKGNFIAYTYEEQAVEEYTNFEGEAELVDVTKERLVIADGRGGHSYQVAPAVKRWGWVPNSDLLWFEETELSMFYVAGYYGNNSLKLFDPSSQITSELLPAGKTKLGYRWSPDGQQVLYVTTDTGDKSLNCCELNLYVADRSTGQSRHLMYLPYAGGDRGGPPPIPVFYWSDDSSFVYTAFTPFYFDQRESEAGLDQRFKKGFLHIYRIPVNGLEPELLFDKARSIITNEESPLKVSFNSDFSMVVFLEKVYDDQSESDYNAYDYTGLSLVAYDFDTGQKTVVVNEYTNEYVAHTSYESNPLWIYDGKMILLRNGPGVGVHADVYNLASGEILNSFLLPADVIDIVPSDFGKGMGHAFAHNGEVVQIINEEGGEIILEEVTDLNLRLK